ncbi:MAG: UDP-2,3-diacylglucosamine diphosphatase [Bacteroidia bacterium]
MQNIQKRKLEVAVLSDLHLGTFGCHALEIVQYLKSIQPKILVLNGDIIDIWQFRRKYFPATHMQVIRELFKLMEQGSKVYYITGNHDEALRKYSGTEIGNLILDDKLVLELDGKKTWIFHGDVFDATTKGGAKFIAKLGGHGYDFLIWLNHITNKILTLLGKEKRSFSKQVKNSVKKAVAWINDFENTAAELAIEKGFDYVVCGHIHQPQIKEYVNNKGKTTYLNSGDWIENLSALEYERGSWKIHYFEEQPQIKSLKIDLPDIPKIPDVITEKVAFWIQSVL